MKILVNYANDKYKKAQNLNSWSGKYIGKVDKIFSFGPKDIAPEYRRQHIDIFSETRGDGLWLWKPYFINKVLNEAEEDDYIFYVDSGAFFIRNAQILIDSFGQDENIWVSDNPLLENCFTKPECFLKMNCDTQTIRFTNQIQATYLVIRNCQESRKFIKQWLELCEQKELISPAGNNTPQTQLGTGFVAHREDQSLLSLLCKKNGIVPHKDPSQRGKFPETFYSDMYAFNIPKHDDKYKSILFLHKVGSLSPLGILRVIFNTYRAKNRYQKRVKP